MSDFVAADYRWHYRTQDEFVCMVLVRWDNDLDTAGCTFWRCLAVQNCFMRPPGRTRAFVQVG